jgi:hypothetical protein
MCLTIKENYLKATEDIVCYKVYIKKDSLQCFISPFKNCQQPELYTLQKSSGLYSAGLGIHSFVSMEGVKRLMFAFGSFITDFIRKGPCVKFKIVKCIIPKDSYFAFGTDDFTKCTAYCSHHLIDVEELDIIDSTNWIEKLIQYYEGSRSTSES